MPSTQKWQVSNYYLYSSIDPAVRAVLTIGESFFSPGDSDENGKLYFPNNYLTDRNSQFNCFYIIIPLPLANLYVFFDYIGWFELWRQQISKYSFFIDVNILPKALSPQYSAYHKGIISLGKVPPFCEHKSTVCKQLHEEIYTVRNFPSHKM